MELKGIDVSSHNGKIDWKKVRDAGVQFAILRCHQRFGAEATFEDNYTGCQKNEIPVGAYKYSYALTEAQARTEAEDVLEALEGKKLDLPVFYDLEESTQYALGPTKVEKIAQAFMDAVSRRGYKVGIYCNSSWYYGLLTPALKEYDCWIANVPYEWDDDGTVQARLKPTAGIAWQYSWKGRITGIDGDVDMDMLYKDYVGVSAGSPTSGNSETIVIDPRVTAEDVLDVFRSWIGRNERNGSHRQIIDLYNSHTPRARGYTVQYSDAWCDATVSAAFIKLGATDLIGGTECGVEEHVKLFQKAGIWIEDGTITPKPGDIIVYNWDQGYQPNNGYADHIGIVESTGGGKIVTIEGNYNDSVARRVLDVGTGNIRGYARPKYAHGSTGNVQKPAENVQKPGESVQKPAENAQRPNKVPGWVGRVTADRLNVRTWAGTENPNIKSYPILARGNLVDVCDTVYAADGAVWYYVRIAGQWYGFVHSDYISRA